jgi:16S rRNA (cytosine967-C5)-methyltransferase
VTETTDKIHRAQLFQASELLALILAGTMPADKQMELFFRNNRQMGKRDRGFVAETVYGTLRRLRLVETLAGEQLPSESHKRAEILIATYLLAFSGWAGRTLESKGFMNDASPLVTQVRTVDRTALSFAVRANLPDWLAERLLAQFGEEETLMLADALNQPATLDLRVNPHKASREQVMERLANEGYPVEPTHYSPLGMRRTDRAPLFTLASFKAGWFEVQDEGSQLISMLVAPQKREQVIDFCAGAGGKTLHLSALMGNSGAVFAFDVSERRLDNLRPRLARAGVDNVRTQLIRDEHDKALKKFLDRADRVLVDAPCSGTGTVRRNPDIKWRPIDLKALRSTQLSILEAAAKLVKPGGRLVYATCSLLKEENDDIVAAFLESHGEFAIKRADEIFAAQGITIDDGFTAEGAMRLLPHRHGTDGFFAAVLERKTQE